LVSSNGPVDVVTFGEAMLRLSPPSFKRLEQTQSLDVAVGGAELNVAAGVSRMGLRSQWVSRLPDNPLGRMAGNKAAEMGVGVDFVEWDAAARMGLYFVEYGASPRASSVLYDRAGSAAASMDEARFDWETILAGTRAFHTTGITPALSGSCARQVEIAIETAHKLGIPVTYDLNFRARLWSSDAAREIQGPLMSMLDVLFTTEEDAERVFGIGGSDHGEVARRLSEQFGIPTVVVTIRGDLSVLRNTWTAIAYSEGQICDDRVYEIELIDRIGGGDAFAAGFVTGWLEAGVQQGLRLGNALSALKQTSWGDMPFVARREVDALLAGGGTRIVR
jgi:2-dehydro-3-deoxygluconokinase